MKETIKKVLKKATAKKTVAQKEAAQPTVPKGYNPDLPASKQREYR